MISPNFNQLGLRPRRLRIKRYHARFRAIMVNYSSSNARLIYYMLNRCGECGEIVLKQGRSYTGSTVDRLSLLLLLAAGKLVG